ncbi:hypothetical protein HELRODRAFT_183131 [Helobdella robusta]|uniref:Uncharacterized protein n=1 Tax=Helobdella robusta TaxID=6412 RepID=T1FJ63_HELRO|nr:hypothetical protein HELRODRAFT_183131 [Helobdella robusta]ESN89848.1 hypothetical protein HELRODRAFT_183131 [Helobdella robusta]
MNYEDDSSEDSLPEAIVSVPKETITSILYPCPYPMCCHCMMHGRTPFSTQKIYAPWGDNGPCYPMYSGGVCGISGPFAAVPPCYLPSPKNACEHGITITNEKKAPPYLGPNDVWVPTRKQHSNLSQGTNFDKKSEKSGTSSALSMMTKGTKNNGNNGNNNSNISTKKSTDMIDRSEENNDDDDEDDENERTIFQLMTKKEDPDTIKGIYMKAVSDQIKNKFTQKNLRNTMNLLSENNNAKAKSSVGINNAPNKSSTMKEIARKIMNSHPNSSNNQSDSDQPKCSATSSCFSTFCMPFCSKPCCYPPFCCPRPGCGVPAVFTPACSAPLCCAPSCCAPSYCPCGSSSNATTADDDASSDLPGRKPTTDLAEADLENLVNGSLHGLKAAEHSCFPQIDNQCFCPPYCGPMSIMYTSRKLTVDEQNQLGTELCKLQIENLRKYRASMGIIDPVDYDPELVHSFKSKPTKDIGVEPSTEKNRRRSTGINSVNNDVRKNLVGDAYEPQKEDANGDAAKTDLEKNMSGLKEEEFDEDGEPKRKKNELVLIFPAPNKPARPTLRCACPPPIPSPFKVTIPPVDCTPCKQTTLTPSRVKLGNFLDGLVNEDKKCSEKKEEEPIHMYLCPCPFAKIPKPKCCLCPCPCSCPCPGSCPCSCFGPCGCPFPCGPCACPSFCPCSSPCSSCGPTDSSPSNDALGFNNGNNGRRASNRNNGNNIFESWNTNSDNNNPPLRWNTNNGHNASPISNGVRKISSIKRPSIATKLTTPPSVMTGLTKNLSALTGKSAPTSGFVTERQNFEDELEQQEEVDSCKSPPCYGNTPCWYGRSCGACGCCGCGCRCGLGCCPTGPACCGCPGCCGLNPPAPLPPVCLCPPGCICQSPYPCVYPCLPPPPPIPPNLGAPACGPCLSAYRAPVCRLPACGNNFPYKILQTTVSD